MELSEELLTAISELFQVHTSGRVVEDSIDDDYAHYLTQLTDGFGRQVLSFQGLHFKMHVLTRVPKLLRLMPGLRKLDLFDNLLQDSGVQALSQILLANPQITSLDIGRNDLSEGCLICLCDLIRDLPIRRLQLGSRSLQWQINRFSPEALSHIVDTIAAADRLECVGLAGTCAGKDMRKSREMRKLAVHVGRLVATSGRLSTLDVSSLGFVEADQATLGDGFGQSASLRYLNISGNSFPKTSRLVEAIARVRTLRYLDLSNCRLQTPACLALANELKGEWALAWLNLSGNRIASVGIQALMDSLRENNTLWSLDLSGNVFDEAVAGKLKLMLAENSVLASLSLSRNHLGDKVALVIAEALEVNESLAELSLASCRITTIGAVAVVAAIAENVAMRKLSLRDNFLSKNCGFEMLEILARNETLVSFDLSSNQIDTFSIAAIAELCQRNQTLSRRRKLLPLKREIIRLSIQKSKVPMAEEKLAQLTARFEALDQENSALQGQIDGLSAQSDSALSMANRAISDFEKMIEEEKNAIEDMKVTIVTMTAETQQQIVDMKQKTESQRAACQTDSEAADRVEEEASRAAVENEQLQQRMKQEIAQLEASLAEVESVMRKRSDLKTYKIPDVPIGIDVADSVSALIEAPDQRDPEPAPEVASRVTVKKSQTINPRLPSPRRLRKSVRATFAATKK
jgi:Leucine-rich repeat (LRR) protein